MKASILPVMLTAAIGCGGQATPVIVAPADRVTTGAPTDSVPATPAPAPIANAAPAPVAPSPAPISAARWTLESGGTTDFTGVWGSAAGDVYAVGFGAVSMQRSSGDGAWRAVPGAPPSLYGIWGLSAGDLYAVGDPGSRPNYEHIARSSDGATWSEQTRYGTSLFTVLWGTGADSLLLGAQHGIARSTDHGATWTPAALPTFADGSSITTYWFTGGAGELFAVGQLIAYGGPGAQALPILRSSDGGASWTAQYVPSRGSAPGALHGIWGAGDDLYAVGVDSSGVLLHSADRGASWQRWADDSLPYLRAVWGPSPDDVYVAGNAGTLLRSTDRGASWSRVASGATADLTALWASGPDDVYAVGSAGTIVHLHK